MDRYLYFSFELWTNIKFLLTKETHSHCEKVVERTEKNFN